MNTNISNIAAKPLICISALAAFAILCGVGQAAERWQELSQGPGRHDAFVCTNETLKGTYGFTITGIRPAMKGGPQVSIVGTALTTFHGDGTFDQFDNINVNSPEVPYQPDRPGYGTYSLSSDCSGTMSLTAGGVTLTLSITVVDHGLEVYTAVVTPAVLVMSNGRRT